jgi:CRISPR type III-A/MTUBE-associated protein Csm6
LFWCKKELRELSYVLFSAIGDSDPLREDYDGPVLHIVRKYRPETVHLFLTAEMGRRDRDTNCYEKAIHYLSPECKVIKHYSEIEDASNFDAFHDRFDEIIYTIRKENPDAKILLNVSSATPQIKTTMLLEAVTCHFPLIPVQVPNPHGRTGRDVKHFDPYKENLEQALENLYDNLEEIPDRCSEPGVLVFRKSMIKEQLKSLISCYDYDGAYDLISREGVLFDPTVEKLLGHALWRSRPDPKKADQIARDLGLLQELYPVQNRSAKRLCEYCLLVILKSRRGEISDFLLKLPPVAEWIAREYLRKNNCSPEAITNEVRGGLQLDRTKVNNLFPGLMDHLDGQYREGYRAQHVNLKTWIEIMKFLRLDSSDPDEVKSFEVLQESSELRNTAAHELEPITEDDLKKNVESSQKLCERTKDLICRVYGKIVKQEIFDIYENINRRVTEALDSPVRI